MDFFVVYTRGICLRVGMLPANALDYTIAVYPFLLTIIPYWHVVRCTSLIST